MMIEKQEKGRRKETIVIPGSWLPAPLKAFTLPFFYNSSFVCKVMPVQKERR